MSLSIGVVNIQYLQQPVQPMYGFMQALMENPEVGLGEDPDAEVDGFWDGGGNGGNSFYEFDHEGLAHRAEGWASEQNLSDAERENLLNWIENLPYRNDTDTIILHLSV